MAPRNLPHLDHLVPTARYDDGVQDVGTKPYAGNPVLCCVNFIANGGEKEGKHEPLSVTFLFDVILALSKGIPKLDGPVTRARDNLPVICAEADGKHVGGVSNKATGSQASVEIPKTESVIPGRRQGELTVGRNNDVGDKVVMAMKNALRISVGVLVAS